MIGSMNNIRIRGVPTFTCTFFMELERNYQREGGKIQMYFVVQQALDLNGQFFSHLFLNNYLWIYCIFFGSSYYSVLNILVVYLQ